MYRDRLEEQGVEPCTSCKADCRCEPRKTRSICKAGALPDELHPLDDLMEMSATVPHSYSAGAEPQRVFSIKGHYIVGGTPAVVGRERFSRMDHDSTALALQCLGLD